MAYPNPYAPTYSYTGFAAGLGDGSFPGPQVDIDFAAFSAAQAELAAFLQIIARSDGALKNGIVTADSLDTTLAAALGDVAALASIAALVAQADADVALTAADRVQTGLDKTAVQVFAAALQGTSVSSLVIATGAKVFVTQAGKQWTLGQRLRSASDDGLKFMEGPVTAYSGTSLTITVDLIGGSGTHADWNISIAGERGAQGVGGDPGAPGEIDSSITIANAAEPARGFQITTRVTPNTYPVATLRPTTTNLNMALDLFPNGVAADVTDLGQSWLHICNADKEADPSAPVGCIGMGSGLTALNFGGYFYQGGTVIPLNINYNNAVVGIIGVDGQWTFQNGAVAGPNLTFKSTEAGTVGPFFKTLHLGGSQADNDLVGGLLFSGQDSAGNELAYASIYGQAATVLNGSEAGLLGFKTQVAGVTALRAFIKAGLVVGAPTGSDRGIGTINATSVFDDNSLLTCYVLEQFRTGKIDIAEWDRRAGEGRTHGPARAFAASRTDEMEPEAYAAKWKASGVLPGMPTPDEWAKGSISVGDLAQRLWEHIELQAVHIAKLTDRIAALEPKAADAISG